MKKRPCLQRVRCIFFVNVYFFSFGLNFFVRLLFGPSVKSLTLARCWKLMRSIEQKFSHKFLPKRRWIKSQSVSFYRRHTQYRIKSKAVVTIQKKKKEVKKKKSKGKWKKRYRRWIFFSFYFTTGIRWIVELTFCCYLFRSFSFASNIYSAFSMCAYLYLGLECSRTTLSTIFFLSVFL